jgi:antitoxin component YwqK of YwqJK toxin-antitoxin module
MRYLIIVLAAVFLAACGGDLKTRVISTFPDGTPSTVEYFKWAGDRQIVVKQVRYYPNGDKQEEGGFLNGERDGKWTYWHENGQKWSEGFYKEGVREGKSIVWYKSGNIQYTGFYTNDQTDGTWIFYDGEGNKIKEVIYATGEKKSEKDFQ